MTRTRIPALLLTVVLIGLSAAAVISLNPVPLPAVDPSPPSSAPHASVPADPPSPPPVSELSLEPMAVGPAFDTTTQSGYPTAEVAQSKLWFHDGIWWGVLIADATNEFRIHRLDWQAQTWVDTGVRVGQRSSIHPDVLAMAGRLWIATGGGDPRNPRHASLFRYSYDPERERYSLDADFPVTIAREQAHSLTLARDAGGRLWVAWIHDGRLVVNRTDGNDWLWQEPRVPPVPGTDVAIDAVTIVAYGETVAVLWTNQNRDAIFLAIPTIDEEERWEHFEVAVEGLMHADDHVNAIVHTTPEGPRLYAVVKTSLNDLDSPNPDDAQLLLLVKEPSGSWNQYLVARVRDRHTRPIVLLDGDNRVLYVVAASPFGGGAIYYKATSLDAIGFAPGKGTPLMSDPALPRLNNPTSTKQMLTGHTGLVVLASDSQTGRYAHVAASLGEDLPDLSLPEAEAAVNPLVFDTFNPYPVGSTLAGRWTTRGAGDTTFVVGDAGDARTVAMTSSTGAATRVRMCKEFPAMAGGRLTIRTEVMLSAPGTSDATITSVRHDGAPSAVVRMSEEGVFSYFDGEEHIRTEVSYAPGAWYRSEVTVDIDTGTYDWQVRRASDDAVVISIAGLQWRSPSAAPATEVCLEAPDAPLPSVVFAVDSVWVGE